MKASGIKEKTRITAIAIALVLGLSIQVSQKAWAMGDMSELDRVESCAQLRDVANQLVAVVPKNLASYHRLERLNPRQYPPGVIRMAKLQALEWIRNHRNLAQNQEEDLIHNCDIETSARAIRGLERTFDELNVQLAMAQIHSAPALWH